MTVSTQSGVPLAESSAKAATSARVLVAESPWAVAEAIRRRVETLGHIVVGVVDDPNEIVTLAHRLAPDAVLLGSCIAGQLAESKQLDDVCERLDCPCVWDLDEALNAAGAAWDRVLSLRLELALSHTELTRERARADHAEQTNRVTARSVHEINNLLSAIRCNAFLIESELVAASVLDAANDITAAVERSAALVKELSSMLRDQRLATPASTPPRTVSSLPPPSTPSQWPSALSTENNERSMYIVLVVDDDPVVRRAVARFVASAGYRVIESSSPEQALAAAERYPVDLMITDLVMPNMTGYELARRVALVRPHARVIYMSGFGPEELVAERNQGGVPDPIFLQKPFAVDALMPSVFAMLAEDKMRGPRLHNARLSNKQ